MRLLADVNFNNNILRGVRRQLRHADIVRAQDVGLSAAEDPLVLEWAAQEGRVLLTHDVNTGRRFAEERVASGLPMAGVIFVPQPFSMAEIIDDLVLFIECSHSQELWGTWIFLPLR